jgi:alpha-N-arabinofuranosidase
MMSKKIRLSAPVICLLLFACLFGNMAYAAENKLVVHADQGEQKIHRFIYGQFAEHLGHCIYDGIWVGEDSPIPNTRGIRNDVVEALKQIKVPIVRWPGGCFAYTYHWKDGISARSRPAQRAEKRCNERR